MLLFVVRRCLQAIPALFGLVVLVFILVRIIPNDPAAILAGDNASPEMIAAIRQQYGFDRSLIEQFLIYVRQLGSGSLGVSYLTQRPITEEILSRLPATLELALSAITLATVVGIPLGLVAALQHNSLADHALRLFTIGGLAIASFWLALMLQYLFSMELDLLPVHGRLTQDVSPPPFFTGFYLIDSLAAGRLDLFQDAFTHLILPTMTLAIGPMATIMRFTRAAVLTTLRREFVEYGRAVGYSRFRLMTKYVLRNSLITPVTQIGLLLGGVLAGAVVVESIYDWPGLGSYAVLAIASSDYQATLAVVLAVGVFYAIINVMVDIAHALIDPRIMDQT